MIYSQTWEIGMLNPISLVPGHWYISGCCSNCQARLFLFEDLNNGAGSFVETFMMRCPECDMLGDLKPEHYQHAAEDSSVNG